MYDYLLKMSTKRNTVAVLFLNLSKASDTAKDRILLQKFKTQFGISGIPLELLKNFFNERQQYFNFGEEVSQLANVTCGIPQRSSFGPILPTLTQPYSQMIRIYK